MPDGPPRWDVELGGWVYGELQVEEYLNGRVAPVSSARDQ